ncbi:hypothetical protein OHA40_22460 [Nocardia sp. NBC_00508]|uniref:hypothetical protein n=1 Tax=Nocardia sp. NBC_00508 TaxID=2975992 RepID=UPI002E7FC986|nr:hypothetical protein [Nocardia sp. NBC_00508]WUD64446.1 hypothetical protein OHA40_22460 [Nocardia sp. NBC_00508]
MSAHERLRTMIVVLFGTLVVALGSVTVLAPEAAAAPSSPAVTQVSGYPFDFGGRGTDNDYGFDFDGQGNDDAPTGQGMFEKGEQSEKAEKLGGNLTTKLIDLVAGVIKCGLNIATPSVKCNL